MKKNRITLITFYSLSLYGLSSISLLQAAEKSDTITTAAVAEEKAHITTEANSTSTSTFVSKKNQDVFKILLGTYFVRDTNTEVSVNSSTGGIGTTIDMERDLGTEDSLTIPRIDGYYRFSDEHRIDFSWFQITRKGTRTINTNITINGKLYSANSVVESEIKTNFYKVAYGYSFYHTPKVELLFTAGLNILQYDFLFVNKTSGQLETDDVTAPLPVLGIRMDYAISPDWLVHYRFETFYIELDDKIRGSLVDAELGIEYQLFDNVGLGVGLNRFVLDAKVSSSSYTGGLNDLYRGVNFYVSANF